MPTMKEAASEFLAHKRIAVTGVSRKPKEHSSNTVHAFDHQMIAFGEVSPKFRDLTKEHAEGFAVYAFLEGLGTAAAVQANRQRALVSQRADTEGGLPI